MNPYAFHVVPAAMTRRRPSVRLAVPVARDPFRLTWRDYVELSAIAAFTLIGGALCINVALL